MHAADFFGAVEIGEGARHPQHAMINFDQESSIANGSESAESISPR
jgi:hypothetical protein